MFANQILSKGIRYRRDSTATNVVERAEGNASAVPDDRVRSPLTVFHLHSGKGVRRAEVLSTSPRDSLPREALSRRHRHQAERISSRIAVPESSLPPQPLSRNLPPDDLHPPFSFTFPPISPFPPPPPSCHRFALRRRVRRAAFR